MTPLPQHKKSPGEIARLRKYLGVPTEAGVAELQNHPPSPAQDSQAHAKESETSLSAIAPTLHHQRPNQPLKRSGVVLALTPMRSVVPVPTESKLPIRRHSEEELAEARRRDALAVISQGGCSLPSAAHPALLAIGYILAIGGAAAPALLDYISRMTGSYTLGGSFSGGYHLLTIGTLAALPVAAFIYFRKSLSHHHSAFIAIIAFIALVFASLHYFPHLRNAT
ncbi:MAG: hypothetical protein WCP45_16010 [Verrucomicrobiota bacterium]